MRNYHQHHVHVRTNRRRVVKRRDFLRTMGTTAVAPGAISWLDAISLSADQLRARGKACILLWMAGGPSQFETFSPKPENTKGGETKAIATSVAGIHIAENLPHVAKVINELAIIRSATSKEGSHPRASFLMHHGYLPMGGVKFPTLGSNVTHQIGNRQSELPGFVRVGARARNAGDGGFLGVEFDPLVLSSPQRPPENTQPRTSRTRYNRRINFLQNLETDFGALEGTDIVADHRKLIERSANMILSSQMSAFAVEEEPTQIREAYGDTQFGTGCLLARRLIESGVTFVEVVSGGWDTHQDNFARHRDLTGQIDQPMARLISELKERGLLDSTLVVWMGEFGRTPRINPRGGRDHYPKAFNVALAGGGIRGGQVIGATDASGTQVSDRPVEGSDLFHSIYHALAIDPNEENMSLVGRPIKLVDGGTVVQELFG